ncbi:MAG: hypothetical protein JRJ80_16250 [Deltaproteobacteria bacterium]|nr:hypothetical protein [Deltaproteobacteria bacterium]
MILLTRLTAFYVLFIVTAFAVAAAADTGVLDGYGSTGTTYEYEVSQDGYYPREGQASQTPAPTDYVIVESDEGTTEEIDGETVIVVQEPKPIAATKQAPPPPKIVVVEQQIPICPSGIWVDGYWYYSNGEYVWMDGHCVVERVEYVFVHPRWDFYDSVWWFVPGYYRPCGVYIGFGYFRPWYWFPPYFHPYYPAHRPVPVRRSVPRRTTTARPTPTQRTPSRGDFGRLGVSVARTSSVTRAPSGRPTVIYRTPVGATSPTRFGRAGSGPEIRSRVPGSGPSSGIVSQPAVNYERSRTFGKPSSTPSRGGSVGRSRRARPRGGSGWTPSSGSSGGGVFGGSGSGSGSSRGSRGGSSKPSSGGSGRGSSAPSGRGR